MAEDDVDKIKPTQQKSAEQITIKSPFEWVKKQCIDYRKIWSKLYLVITITLTLLLLVILTIIFLLEEPLNKILIRFIFIFTLSIFPFMMYYLFITSRKHSLFSEFIHNLVRLGLLKLQEDDASKEKEDVSDWGRRQFNYLNKFQEIYGPMPKKMRFQVKKIIEAQMEKYRHNEENKNFDQIPVGFES